VAFDIVYRLCVFNPPRFVIDILIKSAGVPIDRYSGEMVEQLNDIDARWNALRQIRGSVAFENKDPVMTKIVEPKPSRRLRSEQRTRLDDANAILVGKSATHLPAEEQPRHY